MVFLYKLQTVHINISKDERSQLVELIDEGDRLKHFITYQLCLLCSGVILIALIFLYNNCYKVIGILCFYVSVLVDLTLRLWK